MQIKISAFNPSIQLPSPRASDFAKATSDRQGERSSLSLAKLVNAFILSDFTLVKLYRRIKAHIIFLLITLFSLQLSALPFTLMLDPAGDAKHAGRQIDDCFERGLTLQLCQQIKKEIEKKYQIRVYLTRTPGETLEPLQNAQFANRLGVNLYISIHLYHEPEERSKIHIYHFVSNPVTDFWSPKDTSLRFIRFDEAHKLNIHSTQQYAQLMQKTLTETVKSADIHDVIGLPFKPLVGISAPAIGIEMSVKDMYDWQQYVMPLCEAIGKLSY